MMLHPVTIQVAVIQMQTLSPLTHMSDQDRTSPYNINTVSSRKVMRIEKNID